MLARTTRDRLEPETRRNVCLVLEILNVIECNKLQNIDFILMYIKNFFLLMLSFALL
jgi:hypothetical protein